MSIRRFVYLSVLILIISFSSQAQTEFSQENAHQILKHLSVDIGPRPMGSAAEHQALQFTLDKFKEYGCDTSYLMQIDRFSRGNTNSGVAVGIKYGATKRIIVIGGHIDSAEPEIPGANDDGSGSAVVIEAARVLGKKHMQSTIVFCCFGGEEVGLVGSKHFTANYPDIDSVVLMLQIDMANGNDVLDIDPDAHGSLSAPRWLVRAALEEYYEMGYNNLRYPTHFFSLNYSAPEGPGSDHEPFLQRSVPSLAFVSDVGYPIHTAQDNFENFNPAGLKRTGDIILKLVERFDSGIPSRELEEYWLYTIAGIPIFFPLWCLWILIIVAILSTVGAFIIVRKKREPRDSPNRIRWSGLKMFLFSLIIVACGWFSSDLIGWLKGVRHPWLSNIYPYYTLSAIGVLIGGWTVKRLSNKIRLSQCPYILFKRSIIMLVVFLIGLGILNLKLTVEPAVALLLISLAMLVRNSILKIIFVILSPWWMLRLIFSEWSELFFRQITKVDTTGFGLWFLGNGSVVFVLSIYILPYLFAITAVVNDSPRLKTLCVKLQSNLTLIVLVISFIGLGSYLMTLPVFNNRWQKEIKIEQEYDIKTSSKKISLESPEYLSGVRIFHSGGDTLILSKTASMEIKPSGDFDTTWLMVERRIKKQQFGDTSHYDIGLGIRAKHRPYTISIAYYIDGKDLNAFDTPFQFRTNKKKEKHIEWYLFPDSILTIPINFSVIGSNTVKERIEVTFNKLAYPMEVKGEMINLIPRTKVVDRYEYE